MHVDPHTLYTSIRQLSRPWKQTVETHIIPMLFHSRQWRIALRVHRRIRRIHPNSAAANAMATWNQTRRAHLAATENDEERAARVLSSMGSWEDEMQPPESDPMQPRTMTDYLPLELVSVDAAENQFRFTTGRNWYALYELDHRALGGDASFRLDLDFGIAWRFDGDGKDNEEQRPGGWTSLDQENGWLSKFYCSTYDLTNVVSGRRGSIGTMERQQQDKGIVKLNDTQLARRRRMPAPRARSGSGASERQKPTEQMELYWDDKHIEYMHLDLALGTEFFVRRSARANLLMRALEAEAARRDAHDEGFAEDLADHTKAPSYAPPSASPLNKPFLHRPKPTASPNGKQLHLSGTSTPPPSRSSPNNLRPDLSPAEQLQMMVKSKAAARAASGSGCKGNGTWPRSGSQQPSRATSRAPSAAPSRVPSRAPSRAPSRPGSPTGNVSANGGGSNSVWGGGSAMPSAANSLLPTPHIPGTPIASPRDMPFFRAAALSYSTASEHTFTALSGYTTPNGNSATSFALRGGGGAQPGGTPFANFKARLRRAQGFQVAKMPMRQATDAVRKAKENGQDEEAAARRAASQAISSSLEDDMAKMGIESSLTATRPRSATMTSLLSATTPAYWLRSTVSASEDKALGRDWRLAHVSEPTGSTDATVTTPVEEPDEDVVLRAAGAALELEWVWER